MFEAAEALDCRDAASTYLKGEHLTRVNRLAIEQDGTCAALSSVAAALRASQVKHIPEHTEQRPSMVGLYFVRIAVDVERY